MKKILTLAVLSVALLSGCSAQGDSMRFTDDPQAYTKTGGDVETYIMIDTYTNCKYVIFNWYNGGGASPLLDKEGNPICGKD
ncbi:hypothetical protein PQE70_gp159 [Bacillus phage vB_BanS_Nate]|uniref:DUF6440 domain-containing protein n=1 Tax=Bacillus phage vB_BanS_Nate TaxID=2894788 RepID=A0AAE8YY64_9CAUD|nr:hypothetical protein PQE70_gp159 [Bacillus phage vB_BanS_Nate]UGO51012.1 hypothetical protein NATE_159 [Bacillus phage vB_BanS_Nate]